jgi:hypothetical protein
MPFRLSGDEKLYSKSRLRTDWQLGWAKGSANCGMGIARWLMMTLIKIGITWIDRALGVLKYFVFKEK